MLGPTPRSCMPPQIAARFTQPSVDNSFKAKRHKMSSSRSCVLLFVAAVSLGGWHAAGLLQDRRMGRIMRPQIYNSIGRYSFCCCIGESSAALLAPLGSDRDACSKRGCEID